MKSRFIRLSILPCIYLLIVAAAIIGMFYAPPDALNGLAAMLVTLPWSILFTLILSQIDKMFFNHALFNTQIPGAMIFVVSALINACLIFLLLRFFFPIKPRNDA